MTYELESYFNETYDKNYNRVVGYVISKCSNLNDVQEIVQQVFTEFYTLLLRKGIDYVKNREALLIRITKTKVYRHYRIMSRLRLISVNKGMRYEIPDEEYRIEDIDICDIAVNNLMIEEIWRHLSSKPDIIRRIFFLYYYADYTLNQIALRLNLGISDVKHKLYRTVNEIREIYKGGE